MRLEKPTVLDSEMEFLMKTDSYEINSALDISWQMKNKFHGAPRTPQVKLKASLRVMTGGGASGHLGRNTAFGGSGLMHVRVFRDEVYFLSHPLQLLFLIQPVPPCICKSSFLSLPPDPPPPPPHTIHPHCYLSVFSPLLLPPSSRCLGL